MRVKIYVELIDDKRDLAHYKKCGFSSKSLELMYYSVVENLVKQAKTDDVDHFIQIEVED